MKLFDSHCHLQLSQYDADPSRKGGAEADREAVLSRMRQKSMGALVVGVDLETSRSALALARAHDFLWAAAGLHPNDNPAERFDDAAFRALAKDDKIVAIGECGLDFFRQGEAAERETQIARFELQVLLAAELDKPLVIHCRNAHDEMLKLLAGYRHKYGGRLRGVIHFFSGTPEIAKQYLDLGFHLSFAGPITFTDMYDEAIRDAPLERILIETDAPFAAPAPYRGKRNEPAYVEEVAKKVAILKGIPFEEVCRATTTNALQVFCIPL